MKKLIITESERREISSMYGLIKEDLTPLRTLMSAKITTDGRYIMVEGQVFETETGNLVPITEGLFGFDWSDIAHFSADVASAAADFVIPGSGAIIDILNGISYMVEGYLSDAEERAILWTQGDITFAFVVLPGALQAIAIPMKKFIKYGGKLTKPVMDGLKFIAKNITKVFDKIAELINKAVKTPLGKNILGKYGKKISSAFNSFKNGIVKILDTLLGGAQSAAIIKNALKKGYQTVSPLFVKQARNQFDNIPKIANPKNFLKKAGFVQGKEYGYLSAKNKASKVLIDSIDGQNVIMKLSNGTKSAVPVETFIQRAVGAPWGRKGYTVAMPFFVKRVADMLIGWGQEMSQDEVISLDDYVDDFESISPDDVSEFSLNYIGLADYQGDTGEYSINNLVVAVQEGLMKLGFSLPKFGADGKFGPETKTALEKYQDSKDSLDSNGEMDEVTIRTMIDDLKEKDKTISDNLQKELDINL